MGYFQRNTPINPITNSMTTECHTPESRLNRKMAAEPEEHLEADVCKLKSSNRGNNHENGSSGAVGFLLPSAGRTGPQVVQLSAHPAYSSGFLRAYSRPPLLQPLQDVPAGTRQLHAVGRADADASVKLPDGIVDGSVNHLGHFDQCLDVSVNDLHGQYCLVEISFQPVSYTPTQTVDPYTLQFDPQIHVWEKLKKSKDRSKVTRSTLRLGLCMPSSCTPQQLQATLAHELQLLGQRVGLIFKSQVSPQLCATHQDPMPWSTGEIFFW
ncbi:uncharacterized protein LOC134539888 [Bacillus rossius redtenbacheri]|uniref:uncharacterized protein LOC134539888 n=1 Tax=Bacillus rossius redtenbacheri TaxID=93214 RepID=UPI002FDD3A1A